MFSFAFQSLTGPVDSKWLLAAAAMLISVAVSLIKPVRIWWDGFDATGKRLTMGGVIILVAFAMFMRSCYLDLPGVSCTAQGVDGLIQHVILALIANQTAYDLTPTPSFARKSTSSATAGPAGAAASDTKSE
mgnify:CR=1 FL=1